MLCTAQRSMTLRRLPRGAPRRRGSVMYGVVMGRGTTGEVYGGTTRAIGVETGAGDAWAGVAGVAGVAGAVAFGAGFASGLASASLLLGVSLFGARSVIFCTLGVSRSSFGTAERTTDSASLRRLASALSSAAARFSARLGLSVCWAAHASYKSVVASFTMPWVSRDTHMKVARLEPNIAVLHIKALRIVAHQLEIRAKIRERRVFLLLHTIAHLAERHRLLDYHVVLGVLPPARQAHKRLRQRVAVRIFGVEELVEDLLRQLCDLLRTRHRRVRSCTPPRTLAHLVGLR